MEQDDTEDKLVFTSVPWKQTLCSWFCLDFHFANFLNGIFFYKEGLKGKRKKRKQ